MKFRLTGLLVGAIAFALVPFATLGQAEESFAEFDCPDEFAGIELSQAQESQLESLDLQMDEQFEQVMPISEEDEIRLARLQENFEVQFYEMLSPQQKRELDKLDAWAEEEMTAMAPQSLGDEDPVLTPAQEARFDAIAESYDEQLGAMLTLEQQRIIEAMDTQLDGSMEAILPDPTPEQERQLEAMDRKFEQEAMAMLTPGQRQQFKQNMAACELPGA